MGNTSTPTHRSQWDSRRAQGSKGWIVLLLPFGDAGTEHEATGSEVGWGRARGQPCPGVQVFQRNGVVECNECCLPVAQGRTKVSIGFGNRKAVGGLWKISVGRKPNDTVWRSKWEVTSETVQLIQGFWLWSGEMGQSRVLFWRWETLEYVRKGMTSEKGQLQSKAHWKTGWTPKHQGQEWFWKKNHMEPLFQDISSGCKIFEDLGRRSTYSYFWMVFLKSRNGRWTVKVVLQNLHK